MLRKALVVDDLDFTRTTISTYLRIMGFDVDQAEDGLKGLKRLEEKKYDLIFSDIEMPNMNGLEFLKRIKSHKDFKNIPVVILTSLNDDETVKKVKMLGSACHICKPYNKDKMKQAVAVAGF